MYAPLVNIAATWRRFRNRLRLRRGKAVEFAASDLAVVHPDAERARAALAERLSAANQRTIAQTSAEVEYVVLLDEDEDAAQADDPKTIDG